MRQRRLWFDTEVAMRATTALPDGTPIGALDTQFTGTYDVIRGVIADMPAGDPGTTLTVTADGSPAFANFGAADPGFIEVNNDTTETNTFVIGIPDNRVGPHGRVKIVQHLYLINETVSAVNATAKLYGTDAAGEVTAKQVTFQIPSMPPSGLNHSVAVGWLEFELLNLGVTTDQLNACQVRAAKYLSTNLNLITQSDLIDVISARGGTDFETAAQFTLRCTFSVATADALIDWQVGPTYLETVYLP